ncbi:hypothetical protein [Flavobacterium sp.]|jgi:hypothetical protein|uniref:hypothetical protein n=1 Tax=Flavobacterium sp. TaxID=239 RepID=UPI0037BFFDC9
MKYYLLQQLSSNIKETGTQFQCVEGIIGDIQQDFIPDEGIIDFAFKLPEPFMEKKAIPTTRLYVGMIPSWFIVFRDYFVNVLKEFNVGEFQDWDIKVHWKGDVFDDYKLFYITKPVKSEVIDFENTLFYVGKSNDWKYVGETLNFKNKDEFSIKRKELIDKYFDIKPIHLQLNLSILKYDIFRISDIPIVGGFYFVSEKLKRYIEEQKFTGFAFQEIEEMDKRIKIIY